MSIGADRGGSVMASDGGPFRTPTVEVHPIESIATGFPIIDGEEQEETEDRDEKPGCLTPLWMLAIFCLINLINYVDRGAIASNGVNGRQGNHTCLPAEECYRGYGIQGDFHLSNFQDGVLPAAFMVGLLVASPIFAQLSKTYNQFHLIGWGLTVWTIAVGACGFTVGFWSLTFCRMFVGVGEASFVSLAAPFIDDNAPAAQKSSWLACFYSCIPVGVALGYVFGQEIGARFSWRAAFWLEALLMVPFCVFAFTAQAPTLRGFHAPGRRKPVASEGSRDRPGESRSKWRAYTGVVWEDTKELVANPVYRANILGYIANCAVVGCLAFWAPKAGAQAFHMENADLVFGGVTVATGLLGTFVGGLALDFVGSTMSNAFLLNASSTALAAVFLIGSFWTGTVQRFVPMLAVGEFFLFIMQGPVNAITLWSVPPTQRPFACAMGTVAIHLFGDVPSPPLLGRLQDWLRDWRLSVTILNTLLLAGAAFWVHGSYVARTAKDFRAMDVKDGCALLLDEERGILEDRVQRTT